MSKCSACGCQVKNAKGAHNVKCVGCRKVPSFFQRGSNSATAVACRECGLLRKRLAGHVQSAHNLSVEQYQAKHPDATLEIPGSRKRSSECRLKQSEAASRRWTSESERQAQSERLKESAPWKGKNLSKEHKAAISRGGRGVSHDLTDERRAELGEQGRQTFVLMREQPGYSDRQSQAIRLRAAREGADFGLRRPESKAKSLATRIRNGTLIPPGGGRGITGFRQGIPHYCRSTLEANFARVLIHEAVPYEYEPKVFMLPDGARWTPDFHLLTPLGDLVPPGWVELKGWRQSDGSLPGEAEAKIAAFEKLTGLKVFVVVQSSDLWQQIEAAFGTLVPWERLGHNLKTHPAVFGRVS